MTYTDADFERDIAMITPFDTESGAFDAAAERIIADRNRLQEMVAGHKERIAHEVERVRKLQAERDALKAEVERLKDASADIISKLADAYAETAAAEKVCEAVGDMKAAADQPAPVKNVAWNVVWSRHDEWEQVKR